MLGNEGLLFDELYEKTKDCGRVQFVKLLMEKERENQELKKELQTKHDGFMASTDELCEYATENEKLRKQNDFLRERENKLQLIEMKEKEFTKWLENEINSYKNKNSYMVTDILGSYNLNDIELGLLKEILQKHKEILEDDKE